MLDFHSYQEVKGQKYLGIATINYNGVMLRYKIVVSKDGTTYFPASASYNIGTEGQDRYISAFCIDSNMQNEILKELIMKKVGEYYFEQQKLGAQMDHSKAYKTSASTAPLLKNRDQLDVNKPVSALNYNPQPEWNEDLNLF